MKILTRILSPLLLLAVAGCASQGSVETVRYDVDSIKTRLFSVEKDLGGIHEENKETIVKLEKVVKSDVASVRKLTADTQATIDTTKTDIQALSGKVDDMMIAVKKPTEDLARYREDADKRIIALEERIVKLQTSLDEINKHITDMTQQKKVEVITPDSLYMNGLESYKKGDMPTARDLFQKFLNQYPQHELAANAHYWIGETYYSEKDYEPAIVAFQEIIKNFPQKDKVPAAMLKQALAFKAIKDVKSARFVVKKLVELYPKSEEAKKGKQLQKELK